MWELTPDGVALAGQDYVPKCASVQNVFKETQGKIKIYKPYFCIINKNSPTSPKYNHIFSIHVVSELYWLLLLMLMFSMNEWIIYLPLLKLSHKPSKYSTSQIHRLASQVDGARLWETLLRPILIERLPGTQGSLAVQQVSYGFVERWISVSCLIRPLCSPPAHFLYPLLSVGWLGCGSRLLSLSNTSWPSEVH